MSLIKAIYTVLYLLYMCKHTQPRSRARVWAWPGNEAKALHSRYDIPVIPQVHMYYTTAQWKFATARNNIQVFTW